MAHKYLSKAKASKKDEFFTRYHDIEIEVNSYLEFSPDFFRGKSVLLPCDDPEWSSFTRFFAQNFDRLGLKRLVSTSYAVNSKPYDFSSQPTLFEMSDERYSPESHANQGKIFILDQDINGDKKIDVEDLTWEYLSGDGDFRSSEVQSLRDEADIIVTNPPFSLFREFFKWLTQGEKQFLIVGNVNAIDYKEIFPHFMDNRVWVGVTNFNTGMYFRVPDDFEHSSTYSSLKEIEGEKVNRVPSICWFTNIPHGRRVETLNCMTTEEAIRHSPKIGPEGYQKYDNYNAIEVPDYRAIPSDYDGVMGVPITFMDKYSPDQFEILGATQRGCHDKVPDTKKYATYFEMKSTGEPTGHSGSKTNENGNLERNDGKKNYFLGPDGHIVQSVYKRLFIRHRRK